MARGVGPVDHRPLVQAEAGQPRWPRGRGDEQGADELRGRAVPVGEGAGVERDGAVGAADVAGDGEERLGVAQRDPGAGVPLLQLRGPVGVVGEQEVEHGVRLAAPAPFAVGEGPALHARAVRRGPRLPGGRVEHGLVLRCHRGCGGDGSSGHGPTVPAPGGPSTHLPAATSH